MRQTVRLGRKSLVSLACGALLAACGGGGGGGGDSSGGKLQVISFDYPGGGTLLSEPTTLKATTTSGLAVTFSSTTPTTCTVAGNKLTLVAVGECRIVASQSGGSSADGVKWAAADDVSQLFNVLKHGQTVAIAAPDYVLSSETSEITLNAVTSSGLPATLSGGTPGVCSLAGNTLKLLGKGSCAVTATQAGDANYESATGNRFIAVDPLIMADGILGAAQGSTRDARTKQGGAVTSNPWSSMLNAGWEWCGANDGCFSTVSADERSFTSALHVPKSAWTPGSWHASFNHIDIFAPGITGFNESGDTTGGLQVTTETTFAMTLGMNEELYKAKKPVVVHLDLGKRNNGCNVTVSTLLWPAAPGVVSYGIRLNNFAVTEACGLPDVTAASLDNDIRRLPNPYGTSPADAVAAAAAYAAALEGIKPARMSAEALIKSSNIVRVRLRLMDINLDVPSAAGYYASDLSVVGAITVQ